MVCSGGAHGGGVFSATNVRGAENTGGQTAKSPSTNQMTTPAGTVTVSLLSVVVPMTAGSSPSTPAHNLYFVAPGTSDQMKRTGETMPVARSGGECSSGLGLSQPVCAAMVNLKCAESMDGHQLSNTLTNHARGPAGKCRVGRVRVVSWIRGDGPGSPRAKPT